MIAIFCRLVYTKVDPLLFLYVGETIFCLDFIVLRSQYKGLVKFPLGVKPLMVMFFFMFICSPAVKVVSAEWKYNIFSISFSYAPLL